MQSRVFNKRLLILVVFFFFSLSYLFFRCLYLQLFKFDKFSQLAQGQQSATIILEPQRGRIFDANNNTLATNLIVESVYAEPHRIKNLNETINVLSGILNLPQDFLAERLKQCKFFVWIKRKVSEDDVQALKEADLEGIGFLKESKRYYPMHNLASQVLGIVNIDNAGLEGIELYYDDYLKGTKGYKRILRDAYLRELSAFSKLYIPAQDGYNITLTIDSVIQQIAEDELEKGIDEFNAKAASVIVMNPYSGEIIALANFPGCNLNSYTVSQQDALRNRAICDVFEPGSVFKIITASAVLEEGLVGLEDKFFCENGAYKISGRVLHDHRPHGILTFREIIEYSSNIGTVKVAQKLGERLLYKYVKLYGFGSLTGIDLPGEVRGEVNPISEWSRVSIGSIPIGHEVSVTSLQMARAMAVIANGGYLIEPFVVKKIEDGQGRIVKSYSSSQLKKRIISQKTSETMKDILRGVVEKGTAKRAVLKEVTTAGKTGTAQKIEPDGKYSHSKYVASFIGFAPVDHPQVVVAVVFDEPTPIYYGGSVAAPVFARITDAALKYFETK